MLQCGSLRHTDANDGILKLYSHFGPLKMMKNVSKGIVLNF